MSRKHFGTDGIRGVANGKLTPEFALALGQAAGRRILEHGQEPAVVLGRDTRRSGAMLESALAAGFCSVGISVVSLGVVPTPTVSYATRTGGFSLGGIISASHNPAPDNGIKFVGSDGSKLSDDAELEIEKLLEVDSESADAMAGIEAGPRPKTLDTAHPLRPTGAGIGDFTPYHSAIETYLQYLVSLVPERLDGLKVAVDAAHGAAYVLGPEVLRRLGATVLAIGASPDGININAEGGATKPETIQKFTLESGSDVGVAFDGDADRAVFSDEKGRLINGDRTIGIWSAHWQKQGLLTPAIVVGTVMSNGGFEHYLSQNQIILERAPVGDKYVAEKIRETGALIGGEQSGHIIFPKHGPTGDGLVTMIELFRTLKREGRPASAFYGDYESWPQLLVNMTVEKRAGWDQGTAVSSALEEAKKELDGRGRIVVRPSGTQPMIRVMVEADEYALRDRAAGKIISAMEQELGGSIYSQVDLTHALGD